VTSVDDLLDKFDHPQRAEIEALRQIILTAAPGISEGIKWNAPSFFYEDWFATFHGLHAKSTLMIILHRGAKVKAPPENAVADPAGLLHWLNWDRASVKFTDMADIDDKRTAFGDLIRQWIVWQ